MAESTPCVTYACMQLGWVGGEGGGGGGGGGGGVLLARILYIHHVWPSSCGLVSQAWSDTILHLTLHILFTVIDGCIAELWHRTNIGVSAVAVAILNVTAKCKAGGDLCSEIDARLHVQSGQARVNPVMCSA